MSEAVRVYIERVKAALDVTTDEDLAEKIGYSKQAIANWRRRGGLPHKAELRIMGILGDEFAVRQPSAATVRAKWDDLAHGLAVFALDQYTGHWRRPLSYPQVRAIGRRFDGLENQIRKLLIAYTAASYPQDQVFDAVIRIIEKREDREIHGLLSIFEDPNFIVNEAGLVP